MFVCKAKQAKWVACRKLEGLPTENVAVCEVISGSEMPGECFDPLQLTPIKLTSAGN
jgi:hypothetical protein